MYSSLLLNQGWTPARLRPVFWFEAGKSPLFQSNAGTTAATANGDVVGYMGDLSGRSFHIKSAADDTTRPALQGVGSYPYVSFDGSNDVLLATSATGGAQSASSWFVAMRSNSSAVFATLMSEGASFTITPVYQLMEGNGTTAADSTAFIRNDASTTLFSNSGTTLQTNVFDGNDHVYGVIEDGTGLTPYYDGKIGTRQSHASIGTITLDRFSVGALVRNTTSNYWAGRVYAAIGFNTVLKQDDIKKLSRYLGRLAGMGV